ncbi:ATP-binding protein [Streptomyces sp. SCL15-6]|uniref:sensor histidine kinase n=1 Tax=Streptomyces sp. SCL15-6 TaxID=2967222 RepID=UPI00399018B0
MTAPKSRGEHVNTRTLAALPPLTATACALAVLAVATAAPASERASLAWSLAGAAVVVVLAVHLSVRAVRRARLLQAKSQAVASDAERLAQEQLYEIREGQRERQDLLEELTRQHTELTAAFAQEQTRARDEGNRALERVTVEKNRLAADLEQVTRARDAALAAAANVSGRLQALTASMLADLRMMEERHTDEDVLDDLLHLDHRTAQIGRLSDGIAVISGARSGRRWARPIPMESILRGAMGRISAYRRVRVNSTSEAAVLGHAAEGVMHALAEILDNAANFSPPTSEVHVYVEAVPAGAIVSVEDSGLVMGEVQLRRAEQAVSGDISELGGLAGTRLGLAVVGRLAAKYGLKVSFRPSARGGTGVLVLIPQDILAGADLAEQPAAAPSREPVTSASTWPAPAPSASLSSVSTLSAPISSAPAPSAAVGSTSAAPAFSVPTPDTGAGGIRADSTETPTGSEDTSATSLPKRRRGQTLAEAERAQAASRTTTSRRVRDAGDAKVRVERLSSFRRAVRATTPTATDEAEPAPGRQGTATQPDAADRTPHLPEIPEGDTTS